MTGSPVRALAGASPALCLWVCPALGAEFVDVTQQAGITFRHVNRASQARHFIETMGPGCAFVDYNGDGRTEPSMGSDCGDYDRDGDLDLVVSNFQEEACALYAYRGDGMFRSESVPSGIGLPTRPMVGWGVAFLDYDNDAFLDLFIANGHVLDNVELLDSRATYAQRTQLLRNRGPGPDGRFTFEDVTDASGPGMALVKPSRGAAVGDYDNDGDLGILVANVDDAPTLLRNDSQRQHHWVRVQVQGTTANRDGIGARVEVVADGVRQVNQVKSGASLYSQSDLRLWFGPGRSEPVERVAVRWPGGGEDVVGPVSADRTIRIRQGQGLVTGSEALVPPH